MTAKDCVEFLTDNPRPVRQRDVTDCKFGRCGSVIVFETSHVEHFALLEHSVVYFYR